MDKIYYKDCIVFLIAKANQKAQKKLKYFLKPYSLTPVQALVLGLLEEENGLTSGDVAKKLDLDNATVSGVLDRLLDNGFIVRKTDSVDKRIIRIFLSDKIDEGFIERLYEARSNANKEILKELSIEERILLKRLLRDLK